MKKFFGNFFIFLSVLLVSLAAVPWNNTGQWGLSLSILTDYEMYIKGGIGALAIVFGIIYLIIANNEYRNYGYVNRNTARTAFIPLYAFTIAVMVYGGLVNYHIYTQNASTTNLLILGFFGVVVLNLIIYGHFFGDVFRKEKNGRRVAHFIFLVELALLGGGLTFWFYTYKLSNYASFDTFYLIGVAGLGIVFYIVHIILSSTKSKKNQEIEELEEEIEELTEEKPKTKQASPQAPVKKSKGKSESRQPVEVRQDGKKTMIVSSHQTIVSSEANIDPTNMIYEDVHVDPEFTKTTASQSQPNSIEYYIEKPKMFKPLDPTFDELVSYVREMPNVVTKLDDDRITFYLDRKPFLVLMNFGNYYRMAFKYDLEKGIRLIIKYPTISKNKSTRDELWFKANNYGDIPKDVIYSIIKSSYDNVNA